MSTLGSIYQVVVPEVSEYLADGFTDIRFYRAPSEGGPYTQVQSLPLANGQTVYEYEDVAASPTDWWTYTLWGAGPGETGMAEPQPVVTLRVSRKEIRRLVGNRLGMLAIGTIASATATSLTIPELVDPDASPLTWASGWAMLASGAMSGQFRRIRHGQAGYDPATGALTMAYAFASAPANGTEVEVWKPSPSATPTPELVNIACNVAAQSMWVPDIAYASSDSLEFELPSLVHEKAVHRVEQRISSTGPWVPVPGWRVSRRGSTTYCELPFKVTGMMRVHYVRQLDRLNDDADSWDVAPEWAEAEVALAYLRRLISPMGNKEVIGDIAASAQMLQQEVRVLRRTYGASPPNPNEVAAWM